MAVRKDFSSLTGLATFPNGEPSHEWLGYFQGAFRIAGEAGAGEITGGTASRKMLDELPVPVPGEGGI